MPRFISSLRSVAPAAVLLLIAATACAVTDPNLDDLRVAGSVESTDGSPVAGARVLLIRTCAEASCRPRVRAQATTQSDGTFHIVVPREADEEDSWSLVCHEFTIDVEAEGYVPVRGDYQQWRNAFCGQGELLGLTYRLERATG